MAVIKESSFSPQFQQLGASVANAPGGMAWYSGDGQRVPVPVANYPKGYTGGPFPTNVSNLPQSNPQPQPQQTSGGGSWRDYPGYAGWDPAAAEADFRATGGAGKGGGGAPNQDAINRQIDDAYSQSYDYLNQAEGALRADYPNALAEAESIFNTNKSTLGNQKASAGDALTQQQNKATSTKENALADAIRLYQEQQIGANQRFGGSSSAGQAFSEIQAREQARQFGQTGRQYADVVNQIETQRNQVEREYQTGILQLEQQKQSAVSNAQRDFQNKLLQISNSRAMIGQAKAEAKLGALQELRNQIFAIEQQNTQFNQQLQLMREQAMMQTQNFGGVASGAVSAGTNAASAYNPNITSQYSATAGAGQQSAAQPQLQGAISRRPEEEQGGNNLIGQIGQLGSQAYNLYNTVNPIPGLINKAYQQIF